MCRSSQAAIRRRVCRPGANGGGAVQEAAALCGLQLLLLLIQGHAQHLFHCHSAGAYEPIRNTFRIYYL